MYLRRGHNKRALLIGINYGNSLKSEGFQVLHTSFRDVDSIRDCLVGEYQSGLNSATNQPDKSCQRVLWLLLRRYRDHEG